MEEISMKHERTELFAFECGKEQQKEKETSSTDTFRASTSLNPKQSHNRLRSHLLRAYCTSKQRSMENDPRTKMLTTNHS